VPELTDLLSRLTADQPPVAITRESAIAAGRRARNRRRGAVGAVVAAFVAVTAAVAVVPTTGSDPNTGSGPTGGRPLPVPYFTVARLPDAPGVPGATQRPDLVGSDPRLFHFALDQATAPTDATYVSGEGWEMIRTVPSIVVVARDRARAEQTAVPLADDGSRTTPEQRAVTVAGRPATLLWVTSNQGVPTMWALLWSPVDGLWVGISIEGPAREDALWLLVGSLRLDRAHRCVVPFALTDVPGGLRLRTCAAGLPAQGAPHGTSQLRLTDDAGNEVIVSAGQPYDGAVVAARPGVDRTVAGRPARWFLSPTKALYVDDVDGMPVTVGVKGSFDEGEATRVLVGLRMTANRAAPATWPTDPAPGVR
jgi:hypothetical protein